jgi:hypothetical protein
MDIIYQSQAMNESVQFGWPEDYCDHILFANSAIGWGTPAKSFTAIVKW